MAFFLLTALLAGCADRSSTKANRAPEITVAAAADLQYAFNEIAQLFEAETGCRANITFGSTGQLAAQIEQGEPIDLFAAANVSYIERLAAKNVVMPESVLLYARGQIVLASNQKAGLSITHLEDLLRPEVRYVAIANPRHAPYGVAAKQALERSGLWEKLEPKIVMGENVRQSLVYVQTGNAEAGIVALSVAQTPEISYTLIDDSLHDPLDQALAIVTSTKHKELAHRFIAFVNGPEGRPVMKKHGFLLPNEFPADREPATTQSEPQGPNE